MPIASKSIAGAKCEANANGRPSAAATSAPNVLDRESNGHPQAGAGHRVHGLPRSRSARNSITSSTSLGKLLGSTCSVAPQGERQRPGPCPGRAPGRDRCARGTAPPSVPNCSATCSGAWFGSMMPRRRSGCARYLPPRGDEHGGGRAADSRACCDARPARTAGSPAAPRAAPAAASAGRPPPACRPEGWSEIEN